MDKGRAICKVLKDVRQKIATENGISYHPEECHHKGECVGTCPGCEKEIRYLEEQLKNKQHSGLGLKVAGIAAGVCVTVLPMAAMVQTESNNKNVSLFLFIFFFLYFCSKVFYLLTLK